MTWPDSVMRHVTDGWVLAPLMPAIVVGGKGFPVITELWANRRKRHARWLAALFTSVSAHGGLQRGGHRRAGARIADAA